MGLSDITNRMAYIGDGSSTVFPFPHYFFSPSDLIVNLYDINSCMIQAQALNTNYTVSGNISSQGVYPSGGNVVMNSAIPSYLEIVIVRAPAEIQNYALVQGQPINALALVQQLDYLTTLVQRQQDLNSRSIKLQDGVGPINGSTFSTVLPANISSVGSSANMVLAVNSGATGFALVAMGSSSSGGGGVTFPITVAQGGTGAALAITTGQAIVATSPTLMGATTGGTVGQVLTFQGSSAPTWTTVVNSGGGGSASGSISLTNQVSGILPPANGGTGVGAWTDGRLIIANSGLAFTQLAPVSGAVLVAVSNFPTYSRNPTLGVPFSVIGQLTLTGGAAGGTTTFIHNSANPVTQSYILPQFNGSAGQALTTDGQSGSSILSWATIGIPGLAVIAPSQVLFGSTTTQVGQTTGGTVGQVLTYQGSSAPTWTTVSGSASGSTDLTNQVKGILPIANGGTGNPVFSGTSLTLTTSLVAVLDSSATIGMVSNSSGFRFGACYLANELVVGTFPSVTNTGYLRFSRFTFPGPNPGFTFSAGSNFQAYGLGTDGTGATFFNVGANTRLFNVCDHYFSASDVVAGTVYFTCSTANASNLSVLTIGKNGSGGYSGQLSLANGFTGGAAVTIANSGTTTGYTTYLPPAQGAANSVQLNDGNGNLSWQVITNSSVPFSVSTKTAAYNATFTDNVILAASGCALINLYGASGNTGRQVQIKRTFNSTEPVTIAGSNATIDGTSLVLVGQYESYSAVCDGTNWNVLDHQFTPVSMRWTFASGTITSGRATVAWRTQDYDNAGLMGAGGNGTITVNRSGRWLVQAQATQSHTAIAGDLVEILIYKNGNIWLNNQIDIAAAGQNTAASYISDIMNLALNDQISIRSSNANTTPIWATGSGSTAFVALTYLGQ